MGIRINWFRISIMSIIMLWAATAWSRSADSATTVSGVVVDSISREPLPYSAVFLRGSDMGIQTDENGRFIIRTRVNFISLQFSAMGYTTKEVFVNKGETNEITIELVPTGVTLSEVVVKPGKEKYKKKGNPAVEFVERLMARKELNDPKNHDFFTYNKYEKMAFALNDFSEKQKDKWMFKKFKFIFDYLDTSEVSGKPILNVSVKEKISKSYYRKSPHSEKEYVTGIKRAGIDEIFDEESVQRFVEDVLQDVNIFDNNVNIMQNRFVSPLSRIGVNFYKYYLTDTIVVDGRRCIELSFAPFNDRTFGFLGRLYVEEADTNMFIRRVRLNVPKAINLNYVENLLIDQKFERADDGTRLKTHDDMIVEFSIVPGSQGLYARRTISYANFSFDRPEDMAIFNAEGKVVESADARIMPDEYWKDNRLEPIKKNENSMTRLMTQLRSVPAFYWTEKILKVLVSGYIPTGSEKTSKFDFGPMNTTISGNTLEGVRLRVGGITTANLNKHLFAKGYIAYGTKDTKLKYEGELEYSFKEKKYHAKEFPIHSVRARHNYDIYQLGQQYMFTNMDNIFVAIKRQINDKIIYNRLSEVEYKRESESGLTFALNLKHRIFSTSRFMPFVDGYGNWYRDYSQTGATLTLRYAPGEKFYDSRHTRIPINLDAPIILLTHTTSPKGLFGGRTTINKTELSVQKRFWFSAFGYSDIILKGGKVWSQVNYPDLLLPNANLSYTIQPESYSLMNAMEFVNDQYLSWDVTYYPNGALFNRLPLIKYLKLREVIGFRGLYGSLSDRNNPALHNNLFRMPGNALCMEMQKRPYMEMNVGIDNIFTILRIDYVWRLTYRNTPGVDRNGIRIAMHFSF